MVVVKGTGTFKSRVSGERESRKSGGVRSFKVYTDDDRVKIDHVAADRKRKSIPVKAETNHMLANIQKEDKIHGKNIESAQSKVERKVLADISNFRGSFQKNEPVNGSKPGKGKLERMAYSQRASISSGKDLKVFNVNSKAKLQSQETVDYITRKSVRNYRPPQRSSLPVLKPADNVDKSDTKKGSLENKMKIKEKHGFSVKPKVGTTVVLQVSNAPDYYLPQRKSFPVIKHANKEDKSDIRKGSLENKMKIKEKHGFSVKPKVGTTVVLQASNARDYYPPQRKSFPVLKHANKEDKSDIRKGSLENKVKNREKHGFSVKPKVGTTVVLQVSNTRDYYRKNRVSDGSIKMGSEGQASGDAQRLSRILMKPKPTMKTAVGIPRVQRVSRSTSVVTKSESATSVLSEKKDATSRSECVSCEQLAQDVNLNANTSNVTAKGKSKRRKSYTSLLIEGTKLLKDQGNVTKEEIMPNIYDDCNQLEVAEYVDEIYQHYWVTEAHNQALKNYMGIQTEITPQMRGILINWLIEVHLKFDLMQETLYLMVTLLDYYLSAVAIKKSEMQLIGLTSLLLASKYEDFWHPKVMELIGISAEVYTRDQMLGMETTILKKLNFRLNLPTPYVFMLRFLRAAQGDKKFENLAFFLIELCLVEYDALHFKPSLLCASAIYVARCTLHLTPAWTPLLCKHSHYEEFQIRDCAEVILRFHQAARTSVLRVTYDKYVSADNCKVATIKPLDRLPPP